MIDLAADAALIAAGELGEDATYSPVSGSPVSVRVIRRRPDDIASFGDARLAGETGRFMIPVEAVAAPAKGDSILCGAVTYLVQGKPMRDARHVWWVIEARPSA